MMGLSLQTELLMLLDDACPYRAVQAQQLTILYNDLYPPPRNLVIYGFRGSGKLHTVRSVLDARALAYALVRSRECLTLRHLLSKIHTACIAALCCGEDLRADEAFERRVDSLNALSVSLQKLLQGRDERLVLVLDGIDQQSGLTPHTLPALGRLSDIIANLCLIFIVTTPRAIDLQKAGIPHLHFPPYSRAEAISLVIRSIPQLAPQHRSASCPEPSTLQKWYALFTSTVYDSLVSPTSLSLSQLQQTCQELWPSFIWPCLNGEQAPGRGKNAKWDFPKLLVRQRLLFQTAAEETLTVRLLPKTHAITFEALQREHERTEESVSRRDSSSLLRPGPTIPKVPAASQAAPPPPSLAAAPFPPLLPFFPTLLLIAAYLASHTAPKLDILLFSRLSSSSRSARVKKSYHRRKLFQSPSKPRPGSSSTTTTTTNPRGTESTSKPPTTPQKSRRNPASASRKSGLEMNLNLPRAFTFERLVAIFRAIHPSGVPGTRSVADRIAAEVAELERLRLLVRTDAGTTTRGFGAAEDHGGAGEEARWRVIVPRAFVEALAGRFAGGGGGAGAGGGGEGNGDAAKHAKLDVLLRDFELFDT